VLPLLGSAPPIADVPGALPLAPVYGLRACWAPKEGVREPKELPRRRRLEDDGPAACSADVLL
jgi:hypothetical protein